MQEYNLYSEFDMMEHKKKYINYLEVIILPSGKVVYAVPSHQMKLINIAMKQFNKSQEDIWKMCPPDMYFEPMEWLCKITGCISVWTNYSIGKPNRIQKKVLQELSRNGLFIQYTEY